MANLNVPNVFTNGTTIDSSDMNDNFDAIETFLNTTGAPRLQAGVTSSLAYCRLLHIGPQSIPDGSPGASVVWDSEVSDTGASVDGSELHAAGDNTKVTAAKAGLHFVSGLVTFPANATGYRRVIVYRGAGIEFYAEAPGSASAQTSVPFAFPVALAAGEYIVVNARQTSGAAMTLASGYSFLNVVRIGS